MATLTIRNVPEETHKALRVRAALNGRSVEEEVRRILPAGGAVLGLHTINRAGDLSATDAFVRRRRF